MGIKKVTHARVYKETIEEFNKEMPGVRYADIIKMSWQSYRAIQKMGRFVYGNVWKTHKKK